MPLLDIFSKTKEKIIKDKSGSKFSKIEKITIDYREKSSLLISELVNLGLETDIKELKIGDYVVKDVIIERKTVSDFISSIINKRLIKQLENLKQYRKRLLIIEGIDEQDLYTDKSFGERAGMHPNAIRGFLLSVVLDFNVPIIFTKDYRDTAKFIYLLAKRQKKELSLRENRKASSKEEQIQFILEGFPGIGPKTAKKLVEEFGSIKNIINTPKDELEKILGKKAVGFLSLLE